VDSPRLARPNLAPPAARALFAELPEEHDERSEGDQEAQAAQPAPGHRGLEGREEGWSLLGLFEGRALGVEERGQAQAEAEQGDPEPDHEA